MHEKIALEESWTIPEELENNNPAKFMPPGKGDNLTTNLLDIHGQRLQQMDENGVELMVLSFNAANVQGFASKPLWRHKPP